MKHGYTVTLHVVYDEETMGYPTCDEVTADMHAVLGVGETAAKLAHGQENTDVYPVEYTVKSVEETAN